MNVHVPSFIIDRAILDRCPNHSPRGRESQSRLPPMSSAEADNSAFTGDDAGSASAQAGIRRNPFSIISNVLTDIGLTLVGFLLPCFATAFAFKMRSEGFQSHDRHRARLCKRFRSTRSWLWSLSCGSSRLPWFAGGDKRLVQARSPSVRSLGDWNRFPTVYWSRKHSTQRSIPHAFSSTGASHHKRSQGQFRTTQSSRRRLSVADRSDRFICAASCWPTQYTHMVSRGPSRVPMVTDAKATLTSRYLMT
jgi:hypothetical protein